MTVLLQNEYLTVTADPDRSLVRTTRSEIALPSPDEFIRVHTEALQIYESLVRGRLGHLVDLRQVPMNNDPAFEAATQRIRGMLVQDFAAVALVVRTAVGALQVKRLVRETHSDNVVIFHDEDAAMAFLAEVLGARASRISLLPGGPARSTRPPARTAKGR
ncbi:hypothetical protein SOCEGT47_045370 [Sorangium cellulosum]|uniref:STAS/SEC14 domain-containing protein n=1 Tax=Sorangium cellulosum TaxID=56 RepID=A0A4P2Q4P3_SORCE|nr:hypothetical protein [Sorangium cellulosum]AUX24006.1 hypothetical protein SOCEGT47_045370 [Sorangium cellulosum]